MYLQPTGIQVVANIMLTINKKCINFKLVLKFDLLDVQLLLTLNVSYFVTERIRML